MKMLCFADLHMYDDSVENSVFLELKSIVEDINPDVVLIAGDIIDNPKVNPYKLLEKLGDLPIVCCLGNHEYYQHLTIENTIQYYKELKPKKSNVVFLDIVDSFITDGILFFGNVLWYDGSMKTVLHQSNVIDPRWIDSKIMGFNWQAENKVCERKIRSAYKKKASAKVLITHTAPHSLLNMHLSKTKSTFNMYSGVSDLFTKLRIRPDVSICGHTHLKVNKFINGVDCYNIGNDYFNNSQKIDYEILYV